MMLFFGTLADEGNLLLQRSGAMKKCSKIFTQRLDNPISSSRSFPFRPVRPYVRAHYSRQIARENWGLVREHAQLPSFLADFDETKTAKTFRTPAC